MVMRRCAFKTFTPSSPSITKGVRVTSRHRLSALRHGYTGWGGWGNLGWPQVGEFGWPPGRRLVEQGSSIKEVADVLRHRSLNTSLIYAKVDRPRLAAVALPWPGGAS